MATLFNSNLSADVSNNASFQANAVFIENTLVQKGGWLVSLDTGQTPPASLVHPTATNTKMGYRIYQMNDALAATSPVFMRIDFGAGPTATILGLWITIGTGSNGSGTITNILHNGGSRLQPLSTNSILVGNSYGSAAPNRFSFSLWTTPTSGGSNSQVFGLERSKDTSGNDTSDGLIFFYSDYISGGNFTGPCFIRYLILAGGIQPNLDTGLNYNLSSNPLTETWIPGDVQVALPFAFRGVAQQPGLNLVILNSGDVSPEGSFKCNLYGQTITYQHCNSNSIYKSLSGTNPTQDLNSRCAIRYD